MLSAMTWLPSRYSTALVALPANDPDQALRVADQLETGMVFINVTGADGVELPFGGIKRSGWGRELGRLGAEEFVNKKMIRIGA
jgi:succinate-semialdehyde dehydrogenase / glutarate-semialdehyde dehydrogenase